MKDWIWKEVNFTMKDWEFTEFEQGNNTTIEDKLYYKK